MPGRYALIVATDEYGDPKLNRLRTPAMDAAALAGVLGDPEIGDFEVQLATNEPDHMLRRRIAAFFGDRKRDDLLLLHFSCHGLKDDSGQLYFATTDTEVAYLDASAIPAEFVSRQMAISRSSSVLMLLDCCYSGAIARGLRFRAGDRVDVEDHLGGSGRAIITASSAMEYAFEGDELTGQGEPSVFTTAVVKALETGEADRDQDRWISVRELYDYVCDEVREVTPHQRPNLLSHLEGELYVARSRYVVPVTLPSELLDALANPIASVRAGAVAALEELLRGPDRALSAAAHERLTAVAANDDSRRVTDAARSALAAAGDAPPSTLPRVEAVKAPEPAMLHEDAGTPAPPPVVAWDEAPPDAAPPPVAPAKAVVAPEPVEEATPPSADRPETPEPAQAAGPPAPAEPRRRFSRRRKLPPPVEIGPPSAAAPVEIGPPVSPVEAAPVPAAEPPADPDADAPAAAVGARRVWIVLIGGAIALVMAAIVLHWAWHEKLDYVGSDDSSEDTDLDRLQLLCPVITGLAALALGGLGLWRHRPAGRVWWLALDVLAGATAGLAVGIVAAEGDIGAGPYVACAGALAAAWVSYRLCPAAGARTGRVRLALDVAAAAGGLVATISLLSADLDVNTVPGLVPVGAALCGPALPLLGRVRAVRRPHLVVVTAGSLVAGYILYVDGPSSLRVGLVAATVMVLAGLLAGDPGEDDGIGAATGEAEEGSEHALALEARRREHA
jgi:Caspase domain